MESPDSTTRLEHTNEATGGTVAGGVQQAHKATCVSDGLPPPDDGFGLALALVIIDEAIFGHAVAFVDGAYRED